MKAISMADFYKKQQAGDLSIIDVREVDEFEAGHVEGSINLPLSDLIDTFGKIDETKDQYIICRASNRSKTATAFLASQGINAINVEGGIVDFPGKLVK